MATFIFSYPLQQLPFLHCIIIVLFFYSFLSGNHFISWICTCTLSSQDLLPQHTQAHIRLLQVQLSLLEAEKIEDVLDCRNIKISVEYQKSENPWPEKVLWPLCMLKVTPSIHLFPATLFLLCPSLKRKLNFLPLSYAEHPISCFIPIISFVIPLHIQRLINSSGRQASTPGSTSSIPTRCFKQGKESTREMLLPFSWELWQSFPNLLEYINSQSVQILNKNIFPTTIIQFLNPSSNYAYSSRC